MWKRIYEAERPIKRGIGKQSKQSGEVLPGNYKAGQQLDAMQRPLAAGAQVQSLGAVTGSGPAQGSAHSHSEQDTNPVCAAVRRHVAARNVGDPWPGAECPNAGIRGYNGREGYATWKSFYDS